MANPYQPISPPKSSTCQSFVRKLAKRMSVVAAARQLSLYESQPEQFENLSLAEDCVHIAQAGSLTQTSPACAEV